MGGKLPDAFESRRNEFTGKIERLENSVKQGVTKVERSNKSRKRQLRKVTIETDSQSPI